MNEIINPEKSPRRKKRHDISSFEQEIRNKLSGISPIRSVPTTPTSHNPPSMIMSSPTDSHHSDSFAHLARPPLSTITPTKTNHSEKTKPRLLTKRMGFKRAVMQKLKITKHNR